MQRHFFLPEDLKLAEMADKEKKRRPARETEEQKDPQREPPKRRKLRAPETEVCLRRPPEAAASWAECRPGRKAVPSPAKTARDLGPGGGKLELGLEWLAQVGTSP